MNHKTTTARHETRTDLRDQILAVLKEKGAQKLDDLVHHCPAATWSHVFLEVDRLSRRGEVQIVGGRPGLYYEVRLPTGKGGVVR